MSLGVLAYRGNPEEYGPNYNAQVHEQLEDALEAQDYKLWLSIREENNLPTRGKIFSVINEDNFDLFVELHEANEIGDVDRANAIRSELGLGQGMMRRGNSNSRWLQAQHNRRNFQNNNFADRDCTCDPN